MLQQQKTVKEIAVFKGKGLHCGRMVCVEVHPAAAGSGITFRRTDTMASSVAASYEEITSTALSTTIGHGSESVSTIEHLMAALWGLNIDNALILVDGPEIPIMDGSALPFVEGLLAAGVESLPRQARMLKVIRKVRLEDGDKYIEIEPARRLQISCSIAFDGSLIGRQQATMEMSFDKVRWWAQARTFCHLAEVEAMRRSGFALGGSLENAVVVGENEVLNEGGLRDENEFVAHKILDMVGDLALLGGSLIGRIRAFKPGHKMHADFMNLLMEDFEENFVVIGDNQQGGHRSMFREEQQSTRRSIAGASF